MTPTRRIQDPHQQVAAQRSRAIAETARPGTAGAVAAVAKVGDVKAGSAASAAAYTVSVDVSLAAQVRTDTQRIDSDRLAMLKEQVRNGSYQVDPHAIAARITEEALEPSALE